MLRFSISAHHHRRNDLVGLDMLDLHSLSESGLCTTHRHVNGQEYSVAPAALPCGLWVSYVNDSWYLISLKLLTRAVVFQGFKVFPRNNTYWGTVQLSWGYTLGPWAVIVFFFIMLLSWSVRTRISNGKWTWFVSSLTEVDLKDDVAPEMIPHPKDMSRFKVVSALLDSL